MEIEQLKGKLPPQAIDLEEAVLGAALLERDGCLQMLSMIKSDQVFYKHQHQYIFKAISDVSKTGDNVDILTVTQQLRKIGRLDEVGGAYYVSQLTNKVASASHIEAHCAILIEMYTRRNTIEVMSMLIENQYDVTTDALENLADVQVALNNLNDNLNIKKVRTAKEIYMDTMMQLVRATESKGGITGVPVGIKAIDGITGGWQPSDLIIIAARPSMGKTSFVVSCARNTAADFNIPVAIFSLEMSAEQLMVRIISTESERTNSELTKGILGKDTIVNDVATKSKRIAEYPLFIDDTAGLNVGQLRAKAAKLKAQYDIQMIVIDYLQLMQGEKGSRGNREQEIAYISRSLKLLAKELKIPVIALSQLSRAVETRGGDKKPMLSDLRESGSIEQDADVVAFLYRAEYYGIKEDEMGQSTLDTGNVIFAKHRNGSLGEVVLRCKLATNYWGDIGAKTWTVEESKPFNQNKLPESNFEYETAYEIEEEAPPF